ncbi:hypothetical protein AVEN_28962-1 [Araneus ventricosus]|uniref:Uncharacterized protein n=1 Tax=Araneus ventricosus TaxID=182803 RepID=A0A4Y2AJA0_ARAVE|nr:hypothetical protein AVEN_28962-1 [Araneus ventricosus]
MNTGNGSIKTLLSSRGDFQGSGMQACWQNTTGDGTKNFYFRVQEESKHQMKEKKSTLTVPLRIEGCGDLVIRFSDRSVPGSKLDSTERSTMYMGLGHPVGVVRKFEDVCSGVVLAIVEFKICDLHMGLMQAKSDAEGETASRWCERKIGEEGVVFVI